MEMIDDKYLKENADEIVKYMVMKLPMKSSSSRNWKFALKKEGASNNISYVGFALAYKTELKNQKIVNNIDNFWDRSHSLDEREQRLDEREELIKKRENTSERKLRDMNQFLVDELKYYYEEPEFWKLVKNEFDERTLNYCGIYYRGD